VLRIRSLSHRPSRAGPCRRPSTATIDGGSAMLTKNRSEAGSKTAQRVRPPPGEALHRFTRLDPVRSGVRNTAVNRRVGLIARGRGSPRPLASPRGNGHTTVKHWRQSCLDVDFTCVLYSAPARWRWIESAAIARRDSPMGSEPTGTIEIATRCRRVAGFRCCDASLFSAQPHANAPGNPERRDPSTHMVESNRAPMTTTEAN
jgi:hypothetical protein